MTAAADVGRELALPSNWLNEWGGIYAWTLPENWESRRIHVGTYGRLHVYAASRPDLIAMKFIAHREQDLEHLNQMKVRSEELDLVRAYLRSLEQLHPEEAGRIAMAWEYLNAWNIEA
jgi:hypothetical protein